jgi:hypothetical protein
MNMADGRPRWQTSRRSRCRCTTSPITRGWKYKTLGIVSYGGISAGTRSANQVRIPASGVGLYIVGPAVNIPFAGQIVREGKLDANEQTHRAVPLMLDEMLKVDRALRTLRADEG